MLDIRYRYPRTGPPAAKPGSGTRERVPLEDGGPDPQFVRSVISGISEVAKLKEYCDSPIPSARIEAVRRLDALGERNTLRYLYIITSRDDVKAEIMRIIGDAPTG